MKRFKGIVALDIDGTITVQKKELEKEVAHFLNQLDEKEWLLLFLTGRSHSFSMAILCSIERDYYLAVENGAALYKKGEEKWLWHQYLSSNELDGLQEKGRLFGQGMVIHARKEGKDCAFYHPSDFSKEQLDYLMYRYSTLTTESFIPVTSYPIEEFALAKFFTSYSTGQKLLAHLQNVYKNKYKCVMIGDPYTKEGYIVHVNAQGAGKEAVLQKMRKGYVIGAGDDFNDLAMLKLCDFKIVMSGSPKELLELADYVAPAAKQQGIIVALQRAFLEFEGNHKN